MGGLLKVLPVTGGTFMVGWLAIAGIPPLSGFFSKDAILAVTWEGGQAAAWLLALAAAGLTAFYMSRQFFLTFLGPSRLAEDVHPHEAPAVMTLPLRVLAVGAATAGLLGLSLEGGAITRFLEPVFGEGRARLGEAPFHIPEPLLAAIAVAVGLVGIGLAFRLYLQREADERREALKARLGWLVTLVRNKYYVDEVYATLIVWPGKTLANLVAYGFDVRVIDGAVNGVGALVGRAAVGMRRVQTGLVRRYVMAMLVGTVVILALFVARLQ
jgi:NADH-quinone oxidoreductase subunit L